jgi:hypothetical protein
MADTDSESEVTEPTRPAIKGLTTHENVLVRVASLWLLGAVLFTVAWVGSYLFLPEGMLRGIGFSADLVAESPDAWATFAQIIVLNLLFGIGAIVFANHFRISGIPEGYAVALFYAGLYGLFLGTNSFDVSAGAKIAPALSVLWTRSGALEITSYLVVAAATAGLTVWRKESLFARTSEKVRRVRDVPLGRLEWALLTLGVVLLGVANWQEAADVVGVLLG